MKYAEAVAMYRAGQRREAIRLWDEEFQRRLAAYEAQPADQQRMDSQPVNRDFWGWQALVCENCWKGPGGCDGIACGR